MTVLSPIIGPGNGILPRGQMYAPDPLTLAYAATDTYEKIEGTWAGRGLDLFEVDSSGILTYRGPDNVAVLFNGTSDLKANKLCVIHYALYVNGVLVEDAQTPIGIQVPGRVRNTSITALIVLNGGDYLEIYSKCDTASTTLTADTLSITCWGDHR